MEPLKKNICIVGCGNIGSLHAKNLSRHAHLYFYSRTGSSAEIFNARFSGRGIFTSFEELLSAPHIEAVVLSSPPEFHKDQVIQSVQAGKHVLVEKPLCAAESELSGIESVVESTQSVVVMIAENYYYKPSLKKIKELVLKNYIGALKSVSVKKEFTQPAIGWKKHYGALLEGGIHFIALISDIVGNAPVSVEAEFPGKAQHKPERSSIVTLHYEKGISATLRYSWDTKNLTKGLFQQSSIVGNRGRIIFESNGIYVFLDASGKKKFMFPQPSDISGHKAMTRDFLRCLDNPTTAPYSDFKKAKRDLMIVFDAYKKAGL